jgi:hypothetical protein
MGQLENVCEEDLQKLRAADRFFDAWNATLYIESSRELGASFYEILASRPELRIPEESESQAQAILQAFSGRILIGLNLSKWGVAILQTSRVQDLVTSVLQDPRVTILNLYQTKFDYTHWPEPQATSRRTLAAQDVQVAEQVNAWSPNITPLTDLPLAVVAAMLKRCAYFIGVDNGIKHIAWAQHVPLTMFAPQKPSGEHVLRWMPDYHRLLLTDCTDAQLAAHAREARQAVASASDEKENK